MGAQRLGPRAAAGGRVRGVAGERGGGLPRRTQGYCPECETPVPAELVERAGNVHLVRDCPVHGTTDTVHFEDADLFRRLTRVVGEDTWCQTLECARGEPCRRCLPKTYNLMVDVTSRCNLACPVCCTDALAKGPPDPSIAEIVSRLPPTGRGLRDRLRRPNVVLFGGEPTLRDDLPELVAAIVARGYIPRLATNGVRSNEAWLRRLRQAGLKWVVLQFDGLSEDVSKTLRGRALVAHKLAAIERMIALGFKVQLGCMLVDGVNDDQIADIVRFVGAHPRVFWFSFYPHAAQGRARLASSGTSMAQALRAVQVATGGRVTVDDFVATSEWLGRLYRVLRMPGLRPKLSTLPMPLVFEGDDYYPLVRLLQPAFAAQHAAHAARVLASLPRLLLYQSEYTPPFVKFLVVEKFHAGESIDLEDASNCHMAFMTGQGYVPFDIHNVVTRGKPDPAREGACL